MRGSLGASLTDVWVITAYAIANVIVIPMTRLSQQFGRRNYFAVSIIFTVASFLCAVTLIIYGTSSL
jgi:DHA2 family multidrug resistance protein